MNSSAQLVKVDIKKVFTTFSGSAVFLGNKQKVFVIYVTSGLGITITKTLQGEEKPRPLTHDLLANILAGLGVHVDRVVINELRDNTFYARLFLSENGDRGKRIVELDARPSDCMVVAIKNNAPIFVSRRVLDKVDDMSHFLKKIEHLGE